jgi:hypothetical protein
MLPPRRGVALCSEQADMQRLWRWSQVTAIKFVEFRSHALLPWRRVVRRGWARLTGAGRGEHEAV